MSLLDLCHRFKAASNVKPPAREEVEKRVEKAIAQEMVEKRVKCIRKELERLAPNPYDTKGSCLYVYEADVERGYDAALDRLAAALAKELP